MSEFNAYQRAALNAYQDGEVRHFNSIKDAEAWGDTLLLFILQDLSDTEDCETIADARSRMESAINDLEMVLDALEGIPDED